MFRLEDVSLAKKHNGKNFTVLSELNLIFHLHKITALIGPSGAGKTSLLRLLNRLEDPTDGMIYLMDQPLATFDIQELRRRVGMVFQVPVMFSGTVAENIHYTLRFNVKNKDRKMKTIEELLEMVGLDLDLGQRSADQLSVGQQQRVAFARTLANNPEILLLDEPTASLDPNSALEILDLIKDLQRDLGLTVILITHLLQQAKAYSDYTSFIANGKLIEFNATAELFSDPQQVTTKNFLAGGEIGK